MLALAWLLVSGLMLSAFGALTTSASAQEVLSVPRNWTLKPEGLAAGTPFRLLFVTNSAYRANSTDIASYNTVIQEEAATGLDRIRPFASKFRALASTASTDARDNTATTYTSTNTGVSIWWLRGDKIADNYQDFYDGSWDNKSGSGKNEDGAFLNNDTDIWTGTKDDGTKADVNTTSGSLSGPLGSAQVSWIRPSSSETLWKQNQASVNTEFKALIGLSPILQESNEFEVSLVEMGSRPVSSSAGYAAGEVIRVQLQFAEHVIVTGTPYVVLNIGGNARRALYETGSGTYFLTFRYTVVASDFDANGVSLCSDRTLDRACGQIALNGGMIRTEADSTTTTLIRDLPDFGNQDLHKVDGNPSFMIPSVTPPMPVPSAGTVPPGWALTPTGLGRGNSFRLLFVTSSRDASSSDINVYNNHAIEQAGVGHSAIRAFKDGFRVIASTEAVDARDNAGLTGTGVPIYWLRGAKVADDYADLLDGTWDDRGGKDRNGADVPTQRTAWTGSKNDGTEAFDENSQSLALGNSESNQVEFGSWTRTDRTPLSGGKAPKTQVRRLYALSQVLTAPRAEHTSTAITSTPRRGGIYRVGKTIAITWSFNERVAVRGVPTLALTLSGNSEEAEESVRTMRYASGSGTSTLRFEYVVRDGDFTERSNTPLTISAPAGDSPITLDGARIWAAADNSDANLVPSETEAFTWTSGANHKVEGRAPAVTEVAITSSPQDRGTYQADEVITTRLTIRDTVRVTGRPYIELNINSVRRRAYYVGPIGTATSRLEFRYTVQSTDFDADGIGVYGTIHLNAGTIRSVEDPRQIGLTLRFEGLENQVSHRVDGREIQIPTTPIACSEETVVAADWALKPDGVDVGERFRLLFVTSNTGVMTSGDINHYNARVQERAKNNGHSAIRNHSNKFRVLGSTSTVNARTNTCTRATDADAEIYWLNGAKVADNYADLYDGSWDSNADRHANGNENGATGISAETGTGTNSNGTTSSNHLGKSPKVTVGRPDQSGKELDTTIDILHNTRTRLYGLSQTFLVQSGTETTGIEVISEPSVGDTYRRGEQIEVQVTYAGNVVVSGTPRIGLAFATHDRTYLVRFDASYLRGSGTDKLVFGINVNERIADEDGLIQLFEDGWHPDGATVTTQSNGVGAEWDLPDWQRIVVAKIDGRMFLPSEGICGRTKEVRDAIVALIDDAADCSAVTEAQLAGLQGDDDDLNVTGLTEIDDGDFAGLSNLTGLAIRGNAIETLPVGLFDDLDSLTTLSIATGLKRLPRSVFRSLDTVTLLTIDAAQMGAGSLPDGVLEPLSRLTGISLLNAADLEPFKPSAQAGSGGTLSAGRRVTLGGPHTSGGPWGSNVTYVWTQSDGDDNAATTVALSSTDTATSGFETPVLSTDATVRLTLTVVGRGTQSIPELQASDTAQFAIRALANQGLEIVSEPGSGFGDYRRDEIIEVAAVFGDRVLVDTTQGTPQIGITVGTQTRQATYVRGSGTNQLVFAYTVVADDADTNGISIDADSLTLEGGTITSVWGAQALLSHTALSTQATQHRVDGSRTDAPMGGICARTPEIRDKLRALVRTAQSDDSLLCGEITDAHLNALNGTLNLQGNSATGVGTGVRISRLRAGDFNALSGITSVMLSRNLISEIPSGVFDPLTSMTSLDLALNKGATATSGLTQLPSGLSTAARIQTRGRSKTRPPVGSGSGALSG